MTTDTELLTKYQKALKLAFTVMRQNHAVHYTSINALCNEIGCENSRTALRLLRILKHKYNVQVSFDDTGLTIYSGNSRR